MTAKDNGGNTLLHYAARSRQTFDVLLYLLAAESKLDIHAANNEGRTALHVLCVSINNNYYDEETVETLVKSLLLEYEININAVRVLLFGYSYNKKE